MAAGNLCLGGGIPVSPSRPSSVLFSARRHHARAQWPRELQWQLAERTDMPIIFITGHGDVPMSVQAMKAGAVEFLTKPCRDQDLLDSVRLALARDREKRGGAKYVASLKGCFATLTGREKEVIGLAAAGLLNKQIANEMGISEVTVKMHRGNVMRKMHARSLADLVRMADLLGVTHRNRGSP